MLKLMIVDDQKMIREGIRYSIPWADMDVEVCAEASNGEEALHAVSIFAPDIVLVDIKMPVMDGLEFSRRVRFVKSDIYIIMLSGFNDKEYLQDAIAAKVNAYIAKSADSQKIIDSVLEAKEIITQRINYKSKYFEAKSHIESNSQIIKKQIFDSLMCEKPNMQQIEDSLSYYKIDLSGPDFVICLVEHQQPEVSAAYYLAQLENQYALFSCHLSKTQIAIIISCDHSVVSLETFCGELVQLQQPDSPILCSDYVSSLASLYAPFTKLLQMRELSSYFPEQRILFLQNIPFACLDEKRSSVHQQAQMLLQFFIAGKQSSCAEIFPSYVDACRDALIPVSQLYDFYRTLCIVQRSLSETRRTSEEEHLSADAPFAMVIARIGELLTPGADQSRTGNPIVDRVLLYLDENFQSNITIAAIAKEVFVSPNYLGKLFRDAVGISIKQYVQDLRIQAAKQLLMEGKMKVYEISERVGYKNYKQFAEIFQKVVGCSAREYQYHHTWAEATAISSSRDGK